MPRTTPALTVRLPFPEAISYPVYIGAGLLKQIPRVLKKLQPANKYAIITDKNIEELYGEKLYSLLKSKDFNVELIAFEPGEKAKNENTKTWLDHQMFRLHCGRDSMILALGGGVVGDMAGFVAATYMRGISYIQIPTSLLAMVDSSIGGKVGVDTPYGKNLIGAFWHPKAVIADTDCLKNLLRRQLVNGLVEAVKIFLTYDGLYFQMVQKNLAKILNKNADLLRKIIVRAIELKIGVVKRDEHEKNERMVVNFGHTIGHALERLSDYTLLHGYAVALGILVESKISQLLGILANKDFYVIEKLLADLGITAASLRKFAVDDIIKTAQIDKKTHNCKTKYVLLEKIGKVKATNGQFGHVVKEKIVRQALQFPKEGLKNYVN